MVGSDPTEALEMRLRVLICGVTAALLFLGAVLWRVQILSSGKYITSLEQQSMRRVRLPGGRGKIWDRHGVCLADNRPSYGIAIYVEELRQAGRWRKTVDKVEEVVQQLSELLGVPPQVSRTDIDRHVRKQLAMPFMAWRDIDSVALSRWAESGLQMPGVDVAIEPVRVYPRGELAAHVLGYVGRADPKQDLDEPYHFYLPEMKGSRGIEAVMNDTLTGTPGGRLIRVDASGFKHDRIGERSPEPGHDVTLVLDARLQEIAEEVIAGEEAAVVVLDPSNGDVLAMASSPAFDPNVFSPNISLADWKALRNDRAQPLVNRTIAEVYPPGSTFKPMVAFAALDGHKAVPATSFDCPGYFALGSTRFHCWRQSGHGNLAMVKALEQSCNSYFCQLGLKCGHERIHDTASEVGFGRQTGIDLIGEVAGIIPNDEWKRRRFRDAWRPGDTCNLSIGQGFLAVTPLQMAVFTAAIANGGYVYRPRVVRTESNPSGQLVQTLSWTATALGTVRQGMYDVINAESGTGKRARVEGVAVAGKTGTAEYGPRGAMKKHAWMLAYAPFENPRIALAMVVEDAVSGGVTVAPRVRELIERAFGIAPAGGEERDET